MIKHRLRSYLPNYRLNTALMSVGMMMFFFVIFDGLLMYLAPIIITGAGISQSVMGLIIGSSSIAGLILDFFLCRVLKVTHYRRMFLCMLIFAMLAPLFLFGGTTVTIYLVAMALWGFYYDFYNMGALDFVERTADLEHHVSHFGFLRVFEGGGYILTPFIGSLFLLWFQPGPMMLLALVTPLVVAFLFYLIVIFRPAIEKREYEGVRRKHPLAFLAEMHLWKKIAGTLFPILCLTLTINMIDAAIWTFGPLFSEQLGTMNHFSGGIFMMAYTLPSLIMGWIVGLIARRFGQKYVALGAVAGGSIMIACVGFTTYFVALIILMFIASCLLAIGWPSINAVYTEYIERIPGYRKEIETLQDLFTNLGDIAGPIIGGYMAQYIGFSHTFTALGFLGVGIVSALFFVIPRDVAHAV